VSGEPDVTGLRRTAIVHPDGRLYLERFHVVDSQPYSVRFHRWHSSDDGAPHDHPWSNVTTVLAGELVEYTPAGRTELGPGAVVRRTAAAPHRIELVSDEAWTLFVTGPAVRRWGFHTAQGWVRHDLWPGAGHLEDTAAAPLDRARSRRW